MLYYILDVTLPKLDGFAVCELIRKQSQVPIIMLTALSGEGEQIRGLDLQVDDYITKPFSMPILIRKIAAVLRRSGRVREDEHETICNQNLVLDFDSHTATVEGAVHELTQREFEVLKELLTRQGRILTRQNLLDKLWRYDFYRDVRVVDGHAAMRICAGVRTVGVADAVRFLWDILTSNGEEPTGGNFHGTIRSLESQTGTIDIYTIRDFSNPDAAGNGTLTGIGKFSPAEFDQRTQAAKEPQTSSGFCNVTQD